MILRRMDRTSSLFDVNIPDIFQECRTVLSSYTIDIPRDGKPKISHWSYESFAAWLHPDTKGLSACEAQNEHWTDLSYSHRGHRTL